MTRTAKQIRDLARSIGLVVPDEITIHRNRRRCVGARGGWAWSALANGRELFGSCWSCKELIQGAKAGGVITADGSWACHELYLRRRRGEGK